MNIPLWENINPSKLTQTEERENVKPQKEAFTQVNTIKLAIENTSDATTQTTQELSVDSPRKRKLRADLKDECKRRKILENTNEYARIGENISPELRKLIDIQLRLKRNNRGNRYDNEYKLFSLNIYFASPLLYRVLAKTLNLPSERTLRRMKIDMGTKLYPNVLEYLNSKLQHMKDADKYCIICADEISLKLNLHYQINEDKIIGFHEVDGVQTTQPASQAFVIMARGIFSNWKQQIGYSLLAQSNNYKELNEWLNDVISKIINIGFNVVAFVSGQGSNFLNLANERGVSVDKPYFHINKKKVYYIFDVPYLVKSVRNNLLKYDFEFMDSDETKLTAKWEDIQKFYSQDSQRSYRLAPKLTESHIKPNNFEKMKVKTATQVFSNTVAAAMNVSIDLGQLESSAIGTIKFIELFDKTFDVLNSSTLNDTNKYKNAFASKPYQNELLDKFESFLSTVTVINKNKKNVTNSIQCLKGLKISIQSIKCLATDLQAKGFSFLYTKRLNQDPLDIFFGSVRQQVGNCREPTPQQFTRAFRKLFMENMLKHSEYANCSDDFDRLLMTTYDIGDTNNIQSVNEEQLLPEDSTTRSIVAVGTVDYRLDLPEKNAFDYVCGYLLHKCSSIHKCEKMCNFINQSKQEQHSSENIFIHNKCFNDNKTLVKPSNNFVNCIKEMDNRIKRCFQQNIINRVGNQILKEMNNISFDECCECFPNEYLKKLFVRFRIFNIIKFNNRNFRDKSCKRKYFGVSNI